MSSSNPTKNSVNEISRCVLAIVEHWRNGFKIHITHGSWNHTSSLRDQHLDQMNDGVLKEHHVHASATDTLIVMAQEGVETLLQTLKGFHRLVHFGRIKVGLLRFFPFEKREQTVINRHSRSWRSRFNIGQWAPVASGASRKKSTKYLSAPRSTMPLCSSPISSPTSVANARSNHSTSSGLVNRSAMTRLHSCFHSASSS